MSLAQDLSAHQNQILETWVNIFGWVKLKKSQTLVWPRARKTLNTKTDTFWYIRYISKLEKDKEMKLS